MEQDRLSPNTALVVPLSGIVRSTVGGASEGAPPQNPAEVLAALMDFPGSVALAELLAAPPPPCGVSPEAQARARTLLDSVALRLRSLEPAALKPLVGRRAPMPPSPTLLMLSLERLGLREDRDEGALSALAEELGEPFRSALGLSLRQAQAHVATLRWELTHELRALGPKADRLERIEAALSRSIQAKLGELLDRMEQTAHLTFVRACRHAVEALPADFREEDLAGWCAPDGWIERYRERCVRMSRALFGHLRRNVEGLVRAAAHAEET